MKSGLESSILPAMDFDTGDASSRPLHHQSASSTSHKLELLPHLELDQSRRQTLSYSEPDTLHLHSTHHSMTNSLSSVDSIASIPSSVSHSGVAAPDSGSKNPHPPSPFRTPIKRKPLSSTTTVSSSQVASPFPCDPPAVVAPPPLNIDPLPKPGQRFARPPSVDSPTFYDYPASTQPSLPSWSSPVAAPGSARAPVAEAYNIPSDLNRLSKGSELSQSQSDEVQAYSELLSEASDSLPQSDQNIARGPSHNNTADGCSSDDIRSLYADQKTPNSNPPMFDSVAPPHLKLDTVQSITSQSQLESNREHSSPQSSRLAASPHINKPLPKSPSATSPFASLFGWSNQSAAGTDLSSIPSPLSPGKYSLANDSVEGAGTQKSNLTSTSNSNGATSNPIAYCESYLSTPPPGTAPSSLQIDEMEDELRAISTELAASIRREIDLEDLVERLQEQIANPQAPNKRSSDYFSDSGYSSAKLSEYDQSREEVEKIQRKSEQEKASLRLELGNKLQDERSRRKALDVQIKDLAEKASRMDVAQLNNQDANSRVKELEKTCEDLRRRLSEEKDSKSNFEDLLSGLKSELQEVSNERDNLRDEVVPQLRARVEGLELEAADYANLTYESTKMQQQLQTLKQENTSLRTSRGPEEMALSRSNSVAANSFQARGPSAFGGLSRSTSVKNVQAESREALAERLKDVEAQRDALHTALKNLLERQEFQNRENNKKIKILEAERKRLLLEPRKAGFDKEISNLRTEINVLRRRAEEALEQKWQMEKGLSGLKMDLDRAEEEIASLRSLLQEQDILVPPTLERTSMANGVPGAPVTSESLHRAYRELQTSYTESLKRIKTLELNNNGVTSDEKTKLAIERLEQSLSAAVSERDAAKRHLTSLQSQVNGLSVGESKHLSREKALSEELAESAQRVEQLASQVQQQLSTNAELRRRLADAVARGDSDRKHNSERITELQAQLHVLEEQLVAAQTASEDRVGRHEEELSQLREAHNEQLRRIDNGGGVGVTGRKGSLLNSTASSVLGRTGQSIPARSFEDEVELKSLRAQVTKLEMALADADNEIQQVVAKMNEAQIEVMHLQEERETAARETRRLQKMVQDAATTPLAGSVKA